MAIPFFEGCDIRPRRTEPEVILATVGDAVLRENDVKGIFAEAASGEDSVKLLESYVSSWVRRQVKIQEAENVLESSGIDIEALINDYRNSLLTHRLDQYYVDRNLDTLISQQAVQEYYVQHRSEFVLDRTIGKGRVVRVPGSYRQQAKFKELMGSTKDERQQDFLDICAKNGFLLTEFDSWTDLREMLTYLPVTRGQNYDHIASRRSVYEMSDANYKYYIQITDSRMKGDVAPVEWVEHVIRRIIQNQRSSEIIRRSEDSLYYAALSSGRAEINTGAINNKSK